MAGHLLNGVLAVVVAACVQAAPATRPADARAVRSEAVMPDGTRVSLELARTDAERQRGLMHRRSLPERAGMLFIFDAAGLHGFWMKNTLIALDIVWLDAGGRIVWIAERLPPCVADPCPVYQPSAASVMALEVNAGFVDRHRLVLGQRLTLIGVLRPD
jgi:uncharacterized membrane protein (UPF0127 family)